MNFCAQLTMYHLNTCIGQWRDTVWHPSKAKAKEAVAALAVQSLK
jgi:hypothetical protein